MAVFPASPSNIACQKLGCGFARTVACRRPEARGIRCKHLVNKVESYTVDEAQLKLGIRDNHAPFFQGMGRAFFIQVKRAISLVFSATSRPQAGLLRCLLMSIFFITCMPSSAAVDGGRVARQAS